MKNLKFRQLIWDYDKDELLEWHYWGFIDGKFIEPQTDGVNPEDNYQSQMFTGLLDKQGKEIYEGDIVKYKFIYGFEAEESLEDGWSEKDCDEDKISTGVKEVKFIGGEFLPREQGSYPDDGYYGWRYYDIEVIGNIHENPELLK